MTNKPILALVKQTSLCEETLTTNQKTRPLHIIVKNSPFCVTFAFISPNGQPINIVGNQPFLYDLHQYLLEVKLLYDGDSTKEVDYVKSTPIQSKSTLHQSGTKLTLEVRIKVLTSHMENSLFRVGIFAIDQATKQVVFTATSEAIKVISKSDQVKKNKKRAKEKVNIGDFVSDSLSQLESKHYEQSKLLENLWETNETLIATSFMNTMQLGPNNSNSNNPPAPAPALPPPVPDFATALKQFIKSYQSLSESEKRPKIRKLASQVNVHDFVEMMDMINSEGLARDKIKSESRLLSDSRMTDAFSCQCDDCPYKKELSRIENFYDDIFSTGGNATHSSSTISTTSFSSNGILS